MENVLRQPALATPGNRLDLLRVLLTIGIVCLHATTENLVGSTPAFDIFTRIIIILTKVCVPLFFAISGYLFFRNTPEKPESAGARAAAGRSLNSCSCRQTVLSKSLLISSFPATIWEP